MDERERMLATAWRDLAGWHVGMVAEFVEVVLEPDYDGDVYAANADYDPVIPLLPDPDAPANWGVWLAWVSENYPLKVQGVGRICLETPGRLLQSIVKYHHDQDILVAPEYIPPSVLAWWEAEKTSHTPVT